MLRYKMDVIKALKDAGYNSTRIREENIIPQSALQKLRKKEMVGNITLDQICSLLRIQPGELIEWIPDPEENESPQ